MSAKKEPKFTLRDALIPGKGYRVIGKTGKAYIGIIIESYDDLALFELLDGETVIVLYAGIESIWDGIEPPKKQTETEAST